MTGSAVAEPSSACSQKERLLHTSHVATLDYSRAVLVLEERLSVMKKDDYRRIRNYVDEARAKAEKTRRALERHASEHGC